MGISYSTYLFDADGFYEQMRPLVPALEAGNCHSLYQVAKAAMEKRPDLWPLLDEFFLGEPFEEPGEQPSLQRLLMMVLSQYLWMFPNFHPSGGWHMLEAALPLIGWSEEEARRLLHGDSLCTLLRPGVPYRLQHFVGRPDNMPWSTLYANWLDPVSIDQFSEHLGQSRAAYSLLAKERETIFAHAGWEVASPETVSKLKMGWSTAALMGIYEDDVRVLATARQAKTALAMSLQW